MTQDNRRSYAVGVQKFDWIREHGAAYMDKTKYVWQMVSSSTPFYFLSRPRRFGKSLLVDTLRCYFEGRKELFEGLYIYDKEREWKKYPIIRLDLSSGKYYEKERLHSTINSILRDYEECWNATREEDAFAYDVRLKNIIRAAYDQTGEGVVILVDEYDAPMLDSIDNPDLQNYIRQRIRSLFSPLKEQAQYLRFVFLTGILKFSQLSVFSGLNNLQQITFDPNSLRRFDAPTERISDPIPVLYQSGYLTMKDYNPIENEFVLGFPNQEVREGFAHSLYKYYLEDYVGSEDALGNAFKRLSLNISQDRRTIDDFRIINIEK